MGILILNFHCPEDCVLNQLLINWRLSVINLNHSAAVFKKVMTTSVDGKGQTKNGRKQRDGVRMVSLGQLATITSQAGLCEMLVMMIRETLQVHSGERCCSSTKCFSSSGGATNMPPTS